MSYLHYNTNKLIPYYIIGTTTSAEATTGSMNILKNTLYMSVCVKKLLLLLMLYILEFFVIYYYSFFLFIVPLSQINCITVRNCTTYLTNGFFLLLIFLFLLLFFLFLFLLLFFLYWLFIGTISTITTSIFL